MSRTMKKENEIQQLKSAMNAIVEISEREWLELSSAIKYVNLEKKKDIVSMGDQSLRCGYVLSGCLVYYSHSYAGKVSVGEYVGQDSFFGARGTLDNDFYAGYRTIMPSRIALIDNEAIENNNYLTRLKMRLLDEYVVKLRTHVAHLTSKTPEARYLEFASKYKSVLRNTSMVELSSYLGISPVHLSRIRSRQTKNTKIQ